MDEGGLDGTSGDDGERRGGSSISRAASQSIRSRSMSISPRCINSSPSAAVQVAELHSTITPSTAGSLKAGVVAGSRTLTDVICSSGSVVILSSVTPCGDGSSVAVGSGSLSAVDSGMRSTQRGDGGLGTGSGVDLARSSSVETLKDDPFLARVHSTNAANSARGPSSDDSALHVVFRLAS